MNKQLQEKELQKKLDAAANELAQLESHFDNVAHELLSDLDDAAALDAYYEFRKILQQRIQAKYPTLNFANF
jgi:hypothetical protein